MAKRLYMTSADYLAIAISPALIMLLVGSLVFFLVDVVYVGQYEARLDYAFGLFVFAAVLIARISIEMGSERASLFGLALGVAMFLFLVRFVEHPSPFSHVINLALMGIVWWCAHRLTWDSTVIDDDEDASGEGLMQRIGVDGPEQSSMGASENELLGEHTEKLRATQRLKRFFLPGKGAHTPGLWVLYFSLAALPLFGIGQHWIPVTEVGRRRYVFGLLLVYVAAALSLLVTTSFLNLRRYLRQRRVEMPLPIAGTWVGVGAVLIVIVMMLALLIPRPGAEVAVSRVPWQVGSPGGLTASRTSVKRDGGEERADQDGAQGGEREAKEEQGDLPPTKDATSNQSKSAESSKKGSQASEKGRPNSATKESSKGDQNDQAADRSDRSPQNNETRNNKPTDSGKSTQASNADQANKKSPSKIANGETRANENKSSPDKNSAKKSEKRVSTQSLSRPVEAIRSLSSSVGGLVGVLKIVFYVAAALFVGVCVWKYRRQIMAALADILRQLRELFGGRSGAQEADPSEASKSSTRTASFRDFRDPFLAGQNSQMSPEELVRYTFAAFEAWANDRGRPRTPDCTPQELIRMAVEPQTPLYDAARRMVRMYGEVAYASRRVSREAANELREVWQLMRSENPGEVMTGGRM